MTVLVVSRGGWGDVWEFDSHDVAMTHPLPQEYDPRISTAQDVVENWNYLFLPRLFSEVLGDEGSFRDALQDVEGAASPQARDQRCMWWAEKALSALRSRARRPPANPAEVCELVSQDRRRYDEWYQREQTRRSSIMTAQGTTTTAAPKEKAEKAEKAPAEKKIGGFAQTAKISFGTDKDDKPYGADNNPKRAGSKAHGNFAKYKDGMTIGEALIAGVPSSDISWDLKHGFIKATAA